MQAIATKKVLVLRALPVGADSRASRWGAIYGNQSVAWGGWGSTQSHLLSTNILRYRPKGGFWGFVFCYPIFIVACFFYALRRLDCEDTLVCIDLETVVLGLLAARLRGARVHFDIADPFDLAKPVPFKRFWRWLEMKYIQWADVVTVPHASRLEIYFSRPPAHASVVENVPTIEAKTVPHYFLPLVDGAPVLTFGYFGTLETHRGLEDLVSLVCENPGTRLVLGGRGPLEEQIRQASAACSRIKFVGGFKPEALPELAAQVDVYCSLYYLSKPLHRYAAPNKYFEHLFLGKPVLMSAGTPYAQDVTINDTGWIVEDGLTHLQLWYDRYQTNRTAFELAGQRARDLWLSKYAGWLSDQQNCFNGKRLMHA